MKSNSENLNIAIAIFENNRKIERVITIKEAIEKGQYCDKYLKS